MEKEYKEYIVSRRASITLNVTAGKVDSYRKKEETTATVRVYRDGRIGVGGALGKPDEEKLTEAAEKALSLGIPYVCAPDAAADVKEEHAREIIPAKEFLPKMQEMLDRISAACPNFAISNKIKLYGSEDEYRNSLGRHLVSSGNSLSIELLFQSRGSGNLMDCFYGCEGAKFDPNKAVDDCRILHDAYYKPADIENGVMPVILAPADLFGTLIRNFIGEVYVSGASLVSGKLGQKIFSEKLSLADDRNYESNPGSCFFDSEGQFSEDYRAPIIRNGVLESVLTSKNTAAQFGLSPSKTSDAAYDGVPAYGISGLYVSPTAETLSGLVPGKAVYVVMASGGDTTPDGHFATPVQLAYLVENGKLVGRLPELMIDGDFFEMLGDNYIGTVHGGLPGDGQLCAACLNVTKQ